MVKVINLLPTRGFVLTEVENAIDLELATNRQIPIIIRTHDMALPLSRNWLVETALKQKYWTHALLVDDDVILPKGALKQMIDLKSDVAVMNYPMQVKIGGKACGVICKNKDGSIVLAGLGATLVKRKVFEKISQPWFIGTQYKITRDEKGELGFFAGQPDGKFTSSAGEDTYFYLQCTKHKFEIKATKLKAIHCRVDQMITIAHNDRYSKQHTITKLKKIERALL